MAKYKTPTAAPADPSLYQRLVADYRASAARYDRAERRLQASLKALRDAGRPSWLDVIRALATALADFFPGRAVDVLGPFGLACEVAIHLNLRGKKKWRPRDCKSIRFRVADLDDGPLLYLVDATRDTGAFRPGTLGEVNGLNHPAEPVPADADLQWFVDRVR
jgi:hypothetical protein